VLYRLVKRAYKEPKDGGEWKPSSSAFLGRDYRVSVYRAALCKNDPNSIPTEEPGYVCRLIAQQVRTIASVKRDNPGSGETEKYEVLVEATPHGNHEAHADIYTHPAAPTKSAQKNVFRLLREALADLAKWEPGFAPSEKEE
jgi:hypothetical protein